MLAPETKIRETDTRYGKMFYYHDDQFIGHALEKYGEYSEAEPALWSKFLRTGNYVIDVGANIGCFTLALDALVTAMNPVYNGKVFAFEPQPENYKLLKLNTADRSHIHVEHAALGDKTEIIKVRPLASLPHTNYGGFELQDISRIDDDDDDSVAVITLDSFYKEDRLDFIKIDVEG